MCCWSDNYLYLIIYKRMDAEIQPRVRLVNPQVASCRDAGMESEIHKRPGCLRRFVGILVFLSIMFEWKLTAHLVTSNALHVLLFDPSNNNFCFSKIHAMGMRTMFVCNYLISIGFIWHAPGYLKGCEIHVTHVCEKNFTDLWYPLAIDSGVIACVLSF